MRQYLLTFVIKEVMSFVTEIELLWVHKIHNKLILAIRGHYKRICKKQLYQQ